MCVSCTAVQYCTSAVEYWYWGGGGTTPPQRISTGVLYKRSKIKDPLVIIVNNTLAFTFVELELVGIIIANSLDSHTGFEGLKVVRIPVLSFLGRK